MVGIVGINGRGETAAGRELNRLSIRRVESDRLMEEILETLSNLHAHQG